ncbi:type II toxin-antitoxin system death-on-curing family toxin [Acidipropionibacterium jensenii]|uniref:type II toxin-antitoxin system death-on-curing family toxin n=1 Tax=Acidipropionibacterium jensenii TaxID=1749 RepID=UPI000BC2F968|nr:Fic family protein [Acidipropionibacterium jensenii]MDN6566306.1 Fic family protein [Actinomyces sp.]MDN6795193.1 Fic family protein [Propionibacterium sp.]
MTEQLTYEDCCDLYEQDIHAGALLRPDVLSSAVAAPFAVFDGHEAFPTLAAKAARLAFGVAEAQAFEDGNKRLALESALLFLEINGAVLDMSQDHAAHLIWSVATKDVSLDQLIIEFSSCITISTV